MASDKYAKALIEQNRRRFAAAMKQKSRRAALDKALSEIAGSSAWSHSKEGATITAQQIAQLLSAGANPNVKVRGRALLLHALNGGSPQGIELLLQHGADPNVAEPKTKLSPLHYAVERGRATIVRALLQAGARVDARDALGETPLDAAKKADIKKLLSLAKTKRLKPSTKAPPAPKRAPAPTQLTEFLEKHAANYRGLKISGLPGYERGAAFVVRFLKKPSLRLFTENDVDPLAHATLHPLATLRDEPQFLVVDGAKSALPVLMWEHETGNFLPVAKSLRALLAQLSG